MLPVIFHFTEVFSFFFFPKIRFHFLAFVVSSPSFHLSLSSAGALILDLSHESVIYKGEHRELQEAHMHHHDIGHTSVQMKVKLVLTVTQLHNIMCW